MAIKKSELYSSLWASCDELRGGMDASQYKDYVLTMLFVKYISDKYAGNPMGLIEIPEGASFDDMVALKGKPDIGDRINKEILRPLFSANGLEGSMELVDFNDDDKLGSGKDKVETLSKLIAIFENPNLNFKNNRAEDDDVLGDAYEFLMRHFATESGKSKGQFYTPAEVSRILAKVISVDKADKPSYTAYDPTCGSGSLLLKVADEAPNGLTLYGQEKDIATKGLAIMNMWLHGYPEASISGGNTISTPSFKENDGTLKRFDFVVANPPFSVKNWVTGINPMDDEFKRFRGYGVPPEKNGDYAFLLHIVASLKSTGKGAVILPHGVLFRGNAEAEIRKNLLQRKWIKGIIGLPANLFYGTGIPACVIVIDKENAESREGVFMMDASKGFMKDGNKNRLREQDIHKIVDAFNLQSEIDKFSRLVPYSEIEKNEYNLNIPRYIDTQEQEDIQDLNAHLNGGIPQKDIDALHEYWTVYPNLRKDLFTPIREGYAKLNVEKSEIKSTIFEHPDFIQYNQELSGLFEAFKTENHPKMNAISIDTKPKEFIKEISEDILKRYSNKALIGAYDVYQHLLDYWNETMKDDVYLIVEDGWEAKVKRILEKNKKGTEVDKGWMCDLIPKELVINRFLASEYQELVSIETELESVQAEIVSFEEEHAGEEGILLDATNDKGSITKTTLTAFIKDNKSNPAEKESISLANEMLKLFNREAELKKDQKEKALALDNLTLKTFKELTEDDVRTLVVDDKWLTSIKASIQTEIDAISQRLTGRVKQLAERYENTLIELDKETKTLEDKVSAHLEKMGLVWS
ncbi:type I restriction-modification system subunit M [Flavobacterium nitratireducens]|uniref:type I restriction-modification system subunit M n=1 Tax=Flavobacterium nitratireducens TaxID=992289 RepID=UPI0024157910|nr:type I restriction-modification system subunit M [Flavobacterium nitratireducens]